MDEEKRGRGRPRKEPDERLERVTLYLPVSVVAKIEKHGKDWARRALERAKLPKVE